MKEYQARTKEGWIKRRWSTLEDFEAFKSGQPTLFRAYTETRGWSFVMAEWETEAEADAARLDHIENLRSSGQAAIWQQFHPTMTFRQLIDAARNAPVAKVTRVEV